MVVGLGLAIALFLVAYDNGGYGLESRSIVGVTSWWALMLGFAVLAWPLTPLPRAATLVGAPLVAFVAWTLASAIWTSDREATILAFGRAAVYLGVFLLTVAASNKRLLTGYLDGLAVGIAGVALVAVGSRFFPSVAPDRGVAEALPGSLTRLSFPIGYWNGLAAFAAMGIPLLLRGSTGWSRRASRAAAVGFLPLFAVVIQLTSSRGGMVAGAAGAAVYLAASRRWETLWAAVVASAGATLAVWVVSQQHVLTSGPLGSDAARSEGRVAALAVAGICVGTAATFALRPKPLSFRVSRSVARVLVTVGALAAIAAIVLIDPVARFHAFTRAPAPNAIGNHVASFNGSGRWQFWTASIDQWRAHPVLGAGAGTYETWWRVHGSLPYVISNAHSLFVETLGELGPLGVLLIAATVAVGMVVGVQRLRGARDRAERAATGAALAVVVVWLLSAAVDWVWQLPAVTAPAFVALGLLCGPATVARLAPARTARRRSSPRFAVGVLAFVGCWVVLAAMTVPWLAARELSTSRLEARRGNGVAAANAAIAAKDIEPWASTPYLQLALVSEQAGDIRGARRWVAEAIARNRLGWDLWLVAARLDAKAGLRADARRELARAMKLNPRSSLFR